MKSFLRPLPSSATKALESLVLSAVGVFDVEAFFPEWALGDPSRLCLRLLNMASQTQPRESWVQGVPPGHLSRDWAVVTETILLTIEGPPVGDINYMGNTRLLFSLRHTKYT